jgi:hypothetical protein
MRFELKKMSLAALLKCMEFTGKPHPLTDAERAAGIEAKLYKNVQGGHEGYWECLQDVNKMSKDIYQRLLDDTHARDIKDHFNPRIARKPICSFRSDSPLPEYRDVPTVFNDDGQHIAEVFKDLKYLTEIRKGVLVTPVLINFDLTFAQASDAFYGLNNAASRKKMNNWVAFCAAFYGGKKEEQEVMRLAEKYKLTTPIDKDSEGRRLCHKARGKDLVHADRYIRILKAKSVLFLDTLFKLHANCWKGQSHNVTFIKAMEQIINNYDLKANAHTIEALRSPTLICDLMKAAISYAADCGCKGVNEPAWKYAIEKRLYDAKVIPHIAPTAKNSAAA